MHRTYCQPAPRALPLPPLSGLLAALTLLPVLPMLLGGLAGCDLSKREEPKGPPKEVTFTMPGARLMPIPPRSPGSVDNVVLGTAQITINGWAINPEREETADGVVALNQDLVVLGVSPINMMRPDVGTGMSRKDLAASGFSFSIPEDALVGTATRVITVYSYSMRDRTLYPLSPQWQVEIINARITMLKKKAPPNQRVGG